MSSANKKNNGSLEDEFRRRMQDAEATPAPDLWNRIDHDLTVQENIQYKKRYVFYRQLAAACLILFVMAGAVLTWQFRNADQVQNGITITENGELTTLAKTDDTTTKQETEKTDLQVTSATPGQPVIASVQATQTYSAKSNNTASGKGHKDSIAGNHIYDNAGQFALVATEVKDESAATNPALTNTLLAGSDQEQKATGITTEQSKPAINSIALQPSIFTSPSVQSLMAKDQHKAGEFVFDAKTEAKKQAEALAQELNKDTKADKNLDKDPSNSRWSMSMAYSPTYFSQNIGLPDQMMRNINQRSFANSGPDFTSETSVNMEKARDEYEDNTDPAFSYAVEVKTGFKLGEKLKLLAGLGFSQNAARTNTSYVVEQFWTNPQTATKVELTPSTIFLPSLSNSFTTDSISVSQTDPFDVNYRYRMVSLPVGLQFENDIVNGWNWYILSAVAANILIESTVSASRSDIRSVSYDQQDESPFRQTQFSGNVGMGLSKQVSDAFTVSLGPEFRGFFNTMLSEPNKAVATQGKPYSIGLNMSLNYQLGK